MSREDVLREMIADYRKKIELYQLMVAEFERELGAPPSTTGEAGAKKDVPAGADPISIVREYQFYGKSQVDASKLLLEMVGHPLSTDKIMEGIERGGVKVGGASPEKKKTNLYTILQRSGAFGRAARNTWGLVGWPGIKKTERDDAENGKEKASPAANE